MISSLAVVAAPVRWVLLLVTGFAEETVRRGFAVPQLLKRYNLFACTAAAHGLVAAVVSTAVMLWVALIVIVESRRWLKTRRSSLHLIPTAR